MSIVIWLLHLFRNRFNGQGTVLRWISPNVFAAYIFHQIVVVLVMIPLLSFTWPSALKFVVVSIISVPLSFSLSSLIKKIPSVNRIL